MAIMFVFGAHAFVWGTTSRTVRSGPCRPSCRAGSAASTWSACSAASSSARRSAACVAQHLGRDGAVLVRLRRLRGHPGADLARSSGTSPMSRARRLPSPMVRTPRIVALRRTGSVRSGVDGADACLAGPRRAGVGTGDPGVALARRRDERREGHPDRPRRRRAALLRQARLLRRPRARAEGRAHVALRGGRQRRHRRGGAGRERLQGRAAGPAHRRAGARAPGRAARGGDDRRALSGAQAGAGVGDRDAGDLHAVRLGGRLRARHAPAGGRRRAGDDRVPVRAGAGRRPLARAPGRRWVQRRRDRAHLRGGAGGHAQPARPGHALPRAARGLRDRRRRRGAARRSSRTRCRARSTS